MCAAARLDFQYGLPLAENHLNRNPFGEMWRRIWARPVPGWVTDGPKQRAFGLAEGAVREGYCQKAFCSRWNGTVGYHSRAGAAARGVLNGAGVRKPLHGGGGSAMLSVPG